MRHFLEKKRPKNPIRAFSFGSIRLVGRAPGCLCVAEDLSAPSLSDDMIQRRDQWIPELPGIERRRLVARMQKAGTPAAAWLYAFASIERDKSDSRAQTKQSFLAAIEAEKLAAKLSSSPSGAGFLGPDVCIICIAADAARRAGGATRKARVEGQFYAKQTRMRGIQDVTASRTAYVCPARARGWG